MKALKTINPAPQAWRSKRGKQMKNGNRNTQGTAIPGKLSRINTKTKVTATRPRRPSSLGHAERNPITAEDSSKRSGWTQRPPSLLEDPLCTCNGTFNHAEREWHHHTSCPAFGYEGGRTCGR